MSKLGELGTPLGRQVTIDAAIQLNKENKVVATYWRPEQKQLCGKCGTPDCFCTAYVSLR